jgi:hypothetical protein
MKLLKKIKYYVLYAVIWPLMVTGQLIYYISKLIKIIAYLLMFKIHSVKDEIKNFKDIDYSVLDAI